MLGKVDNKLRVFRVELLTKASENSSRLPIKEELVDALNKFKTTGQGLIVLHQSLYDYKYDTQLTGYKKVDSKTICGHLLRAELEDDKVYVIFEANEPDKLIGKNYICFYRAIMQTTVSDDDKFHYENLFAIDLITIKDNEYLETLPVQTLTSYDEEWERYITRQNALKEIGYDESE